MKIPVWFLLVIMFLGGLGGYYYSTRSNQVEANPMQNYFDSIQKVIESKQRVIDPMGKNVQG